MADRRTTVVIDVQIGDMIVNSGRLVVDAEVKLDAKDESVKKSALTIGKGISGILRGLLGTKMGNFFGGFIEGAGKAAEVLATKLGPALAVVAIGIVAVVALFKYWAWWSRTVIELFKQLVGVLQTFGRALFDANAAMLRFIAAPLRPIVLGSVDALRWLVTETINVGRSSLDWTM